MHEHFASEIWRLIIALLIAALLGSFTGAWGFSLFIGLSVLFAWHLVQIYLLETWLRTNNDNAFDQLCGIWLYTADSILSTKRQSKKRKKRVARLLQRFHQTLEAMPDAAVVIDDDERIEWANSAARKFLNITHRDTVKGIKKFLKDPEFSGYLNSGQYDEPILITSPADPQIELELKITSFGRDQLLLTAHDVTESRKLQAVRRDFIANVSHELRTPLTVVSGYMEML